MDIKHLLIKNLKELTIKIEDGTCEIDEDTATHLFTLIAHLTLSKAEAFQLLGISRSKFDNLISKGILPAGRKRIGFNELTWYKDEIIYYYNKYLNGK